MDRLKVYRKRLDEVDDKLVALFKERLGVCREIGAYKRSVGLPVEDKQREAAVLARLTDGLDDRQKRDIIALYDNIFKISKRLQNEENGGDD